jgi:hypothetical protein
MRIDIAVGRRAPDDKPAGFGGFLPSPVFEFVYAGKTTAPVGHVAEAFLLEFEREVRGKRNQDEPDQNEQDKSDKGLEDFSDKLAHQN